MIERGDWDVSAIARNAFDLEGKVVGTIGAGRIGFRVLQRLVPFDCKELLYYDYAPLPAPAEKSVNARRVTDLKEFVSQVCIALSTNDMILTMGIVRRCDCQLSLARRNPRPRQR